MREQTARRAATTASTSREVEKERFAGVSRLSRTVTPWRTVEKPASRCENAMAGISEEIVQGISTISIIRSGLLLGESPDARLQILTSPEAWRYR